ncbi:MAG: sugar kinase [Acidobacteria bacterium 13_2_20CM_2_57_6]|nr:MAG: sugar kinase [Acidobacteria bacterium 13_2_20CM_2_57_6]PYT35131.1 MAG: sugar kinase [Acidobacteriota bacterium]PYT61730.1 MAG: sugar kinase [Acidobacteriota bacterium]
MRRINFTNTQVASSQTARGINRGVVLNLIRRRQPISRADLARVSGLQRSTVSLITEQLIRERWVVHGPIGRLPRGRRPTFLRLNDRRAILVADLRPAQTTVGVADVNGNFLSQETMPTTRDSRLTTEALAAKIRHLMTVHSDRVFEGVGISIPGRFSESSQRIVFAPNLGWPEFDFKGTIEQATGMRVELENAANACALAEVWFGHGEKVRDFVVVTVSEGIGTGVFANGQLIRGFNSMAGEFGHVPLDPNGPLCTCGGRGCWEVYASNRAALRYYHESIQSSDGLTFPDLLALADSGDPLAAKALDRMVHALGRGMRMLVSGFAPEEVVVVGELTRQWRRFGPAIQSELDVGLPGGHPPRVRPAEGTMARLRGTVALVLQKHFGPSAGLQELEAEDSRENQVMSS